MRIRLSTESIQSVRWERNKHDFDMHGKSTCFPCAFVLKHKKWWKGMTRSEHGLEIRGIHPEIIFRSALVPFKTQRRGF